VQFYTNVQQFYARQKLEPLVKLVNSKTGSGTGNNNRELTELWNGLVPKIPAFFIDCPQPIVPSLLHGDMWSGNVAEVDTEPGEFVSALFWVERWFLSSFISFFPFSIRKYNTKL